MRLALVISLLAVLTACPKGSEGTDAGDCKPPQTAGDCHKNQCDGTGAVVSADDPQDAPDDGNDCTADTCNQGTGQHANLAAGVACGTGGALQCDGSGHCIGCLQPSDCAAGNACRDAACTNGTCGFANRVRGTAVTPQTAGDCRRLQCDGQGMTESVNDDADVASDAQACTTDSCANGAPVFTPVQSGTPCTQDGGVLCDGSGACRACLVSTDCAGVDSECLARTCIAGTCGLQRTDAGIAIASQVSGDCRSSVCDGDGGVSLVNDGTDVPNDNNPCTFNRCVSGNPTFPPVDAGVSCGGALVCDAIGQCVGCLAASDCGSSDVCVTRTCTAGTCGLVLADAGTPLPRQNPSDCRQAVCDNQGNVVAVNDDLDLPADDGNPCTSEGCSSGTPTHPIVMTNTACVADGGAFCSSAGVCVECNAASQCPGVDTDCRVRACPTNRCGFTNVAAMTVAVTQSPGDCQQRRCDGDGGVLSFAFDTDLPADDGAQCTAEVCDGGSPQHPPRPVDTACTEDGGRYCSSTATCVECNSGVQCTSMVCTAGHSCAGPTCMDSVRNGAETDVDCGGGTCTTCAVNQRCDAGADCMTGVCETNRCALVCTDSAAPGATCVSYCNCMAPTCPGKFASTAACLTACSSFYEMQLCCRAYHCGAAMTDAVTHCPHAAGEAVCP